jgi:hypothetical protein
MPRAAAISKRIALATSEHTYRAHSFGAVSGTVFACFALLLLADKNTRRLELLGFVNQAVSSGECFSVQAACHVGFKKNNVAGCCPESQIEMAKNRVGTRKRAVLVFHLFHAQAHCPRCHHNTLAFLSATCSVTAYHCQVLFTKLSCRARCEIVYNCMRKELICIL